MAVFLKPLAKSLKSLTTTGMKAFVCVLYIYIISSYTHVGIELTPYGCNIKSVFKVNLLCCTFDLPARAAVMNINQFNGFFGCPRCLQEGSYMHIASYFGFFIIILSGKSAKVGSRGTVRVGTVV